MPVCDCTLILKALADESRWRIVQRLLTGQRARVSDLTDELQIPQPSVSKHLRILRQAGIVVSEKAGTVVWSQVAPDFRHQVQSGEQELEMGCCTFRFAPPAPAQEVA